MTTFSATSSETHRRIAFLTYPGVKMLDVTGPLQVFHDACELAGADAYSTELASLFGGPVETDIGIPLTTRRLAGLGLGDDDTLIIAGGDGVYDACRDSRLLQAIRTESAKGGRIGSTCTGAFLLGAAGLLDGRKSVTHWNRCADLAKTYPKTRVDPDPIFIEDDGVWTSAGVTAGIDLALAMVEADHGRELALKLARQLLVYSKRPGGQAQFSTTLKEQTRLATARFDALHFWIRDNLRADLRVDALARRCGMSARNFARLYTEETGRTPAKAIEHFRIEAARSMLEQGRRSIKDVAAQCGFGDAERMRRSFVRQLGVTPQSYRERFAERATAEA